MKTMIFMIQIRPMDWCVTGWTTTEWGKMHLNIPPEADTIPVDLFKNSYTVQVTSLSSVKTTNHKNSPLKYLWISGEKQE